MIELSIPQDSINEWATEALSEINKDVPPEVPDGIIELYKYKETIGAMMMHMQSIVIQQPEYDPIAEVNAYYDSEIAKNAQLKQDLLAQEQEEINSAKEEVSNYNQSIDEYNTHLTDRVAIKHEELKSYKETLDYVFKHYHITPNSVNVSKNLSEKQFLDMLHVSLSVCKKYKTLQEKDLIYKYARKLKKNDGIYAIWTLAVLTVLVYITLPVIGIINYAKLFSSAGDVANDIEALKLARNLMSEVDYKNLIDPSKLKDKMGDPDTSEISLTIQKKIEEIPDVEPERVKSLENASKILDEYNKIVQDKYTEINTRKEDVTQMLQESSNLCEQKIKEYLETYHQFPYECDHSYVMSHKLVFARKYDYLDVAVTLEPKNILFNYKNEEDRINAVNRCKLYLCNFILSVQPRKLDVTISDPVHQGSEFAEFLIPEVREFLKCVDTEFEESIKEMRTVTMDNIKKLRNTNIDEFNKHAEEQAMVPIPYKLLIIASGIKHDDSGKTQGYDDKLQAYFRESVNQGVHIWVIDTAKYSGMFMDNPGAFECDSDTKLIEYTEELGEKSVAIWAKELKDFKSPILDYIDKYLNRHVPKDKWWTYDTIKGVEMHFGYENGDPTKFTPISLCDSNVHALMGGDTGSGKSATINQLLMTMITMYPPSELELMFIDFKNIEAAKFTSGLEEDGSFMSADKMVELKREDKFFRRYSFIPHISVISGTTDGGYALSLFRELKKEMDRRNAILNKYGMQKVEDLRTKLLVDYNRYKGVDLPKSKPEKHLKYKWYDMRKDWEYYKPNILDQGLEIPRLVVICDEFQVMFNDKVVPARTIDEISGLITVVTKLSRAMSCHLWFTSQSMKGTISNDTKGNFSLRAALKCKSEVSTDIIGNDASSKIREKQGYIYTNDSSGEDPTANKLFRIPFAPPEEIQQICDEVNEFLIENGHEERKLAELYDDKQLMPAYLIDEWYNKYPDKFSMDTTFILGERAEYSVNKAPITCTLTNEPSENMLIAGFIRDDLLNLTLTIIKNIQNKHNDSLLIVNVADKAAYDLMAPENYVNEETKSLCSPDTDPGELIDMVMDIIDSRLETGEWEQIIFVVLVYWENTGILGYGKREDKLSKMLRLAPTVGVHFFIACGARTNDLVTSIPKACNHRYCGQLPKDAFFFINTNMVEKFPSGKENGNFAAYEFGPDAKKLKIYQHEFAGHTISREVEI